MVKTRSWTSTGAGCSSHCAGGLSAPSERVGARTPPRIEERPRSPPSPTVQQLLCKVDARRCLQHMSELSWSPVHTPLCSAGRLCQSWPLGGTAEGGFIFPTGWARPSLGPPVSFEPLCQSQWATVLPLPTLPTWAHMGTPGYMWTHVGTCGHMWVSAHTRGYMWAAWVSVGTPGYMRVHAGICRHTWVHVGTHRYLQAYMGTCGHTWLHVGTWVHVGNLSICRHTRVHEGTCGYLQAHVGTWGHTWVHVGTLQYMWACWVSAGTPRYMQAHGGTCGHTRVSAGTHGYMWAHQDTCGHTGIHASTLGYMGAHMGRAALAAAPCPSQAMTSALTLQVCQVQFECLPWQCVCAYCTSNVARNSSYYCPKAKHGFFFFF